MTKRWTLRTRIAIGLFTYSLLLGAAVLYFGYATNERIERVVWRSILETEADRFQAQRAVDPSFPLPHSGAIHSYVVRPNDRVAGVPNVVWRLSPGIHSDIVLDARDVTVLVRDMVDGERLFLVVEAGDVERNEQTLFGWAVIWALLGMVVLVAVTYWLAGRLLRPVSRFVATVDALHPQGEGQHLELDRSAGAEIATLAEAINRYLHRIDGFVEREHQFVGTMSHELRTPLASLRAAADVLEERDDLAPEARRAIERMQRTLAESDQLVETLLLLARDPNRLAEASEPVAVDRLLRDVIEDHAHLLPGRSLSVEAEPFPEVQIVAPATAIKVAIANLMRNAIEHGGAGTIRITLDENAVVSIRSPRQVLTSAEIARLYTESARSGSLWRRGIGLGLIARLCEHMGWRLEISDTEDGGTGAVLHLGNTEPGP